MFSIKIDNDTKTIITGIFITILIIISLYLSFTFENTDNYYNVTHIDHDKGNITLVAKNNVSSDNDTIIIKSSDIKGTVSLNDTIIIQQDNSVAATADYIVLK